MVCINVKVAIILGAHNSIGAEANSSLYPSLGIAKFQYISSYQVEGIVDLCQRSLKRRPSPIRVVQEAGTPWV